jgi:hypothetical protein
MAERLFCVEPPESSPDDTHLAISLYLMVPVEQIPDK